jgi:uncharacterized membrane protein YhhN
MIVKTFKIIAFGYILSSLFFLVFIQKFDHYPQIQYHIIIPIFKAIPDLLALYTCYRFLNGNVRYWMVGACAACAIGDVFLGISRDKYYELALISYLIGHILIIIGFKEYYKFSVKNIVSDILVVSFSIGVCIIILPHLDNIKDIVSVLLYAILITLMALLASNLNIKMKRAVFAGACIFVFSDSLNAVNKFVFLNITPTPAILEKIPILYVIISTYYLALFLIVFGFSLSFIQNVKISKKNESEIPKKLATPI